MYYFNFIILLTEMQTYIQNICSFLSASDYPWSFAYAAVKIDSRWTDTCKLLPFHTVRAANVQICLNGLLLVVWLVNR